MTKRFVGLFSALLLTALAANAYAQDDTFAVEQFEPLHAQGTNVLNLGKSEVLQHTAPSFGFFAHYVNDPLVLADSETGEEVGAIVGSQVKTELWAAIGLFDFADLGVIVPVVVWQDGDDLADVQSVSGFAIGDPRVVPKFQILEPGIVGGLGIGALATVWIPVGDQDTYNSDGSIRVEPRLLVDYTIGDLVLLTNVGFQVREGANQRNYTAGNTLRWGAGVEAPLGIDKLKAIGTVFGAVGFEDAANAEALVDEVGRQNTPVEADLGLQYEFPYSMVANVGGGFGLTESVGSPDFRIFASLGYTPRDRDNDDDGILNRDDTCPDDPEDKDGFEDSDGCPDDDNDEDGIVDREDACPDDPEDKDQFEDDDGCPDIDNDQDQILDQDDKCPNVPGVASQQGCPLKDLDGDGMIEDDQCPEEPEDKDGFEDSDGCPDFDNDGDGILDVEDKCPDEAEVVNGFEDEDGCPDEAKVKVTKKSIVILEKVYFDTNKATIKDRSFAVLQEVAGVLKQYPQIKLVRIEGHTDSRGRDKYNLDLSQRRAESVKTFLVNAGIESERLEPVGYGETKPVDTNETSDGREKNRRVEFTILKKEEKK